MDTRILEAIDWQECLPVLQSGQLVVIPTDTVYGVAAMPLDAEAIERLYEAKGRPTQKAIPMLLAAAADAERIAVIGEAAQKLCEAFWPGALSVVARARPSFPSPARAADGTVALRMPAHDLALAVIQAAGGVLAVSSANLSGQEPARSAMEALHQLEGRVALVLDAGSSPGGVASTVVRIDGDDLTIVREGALSRVRLQAALDERARELRHLNRLG